MEHEGDDDTFCGWCIWENHQRIVKGLDDLETRG